MECLFVVKLMTGSSVPRQHMRQSKNIHTNIVIQFRDEVDEKTIVMDFYDDDERCRTSWMGH